MKHTFEERLFETTRILEKYPDRIPIICEKEQRASKDCPEIDKNKYLVPDDFAFGQFILILIAAL
jgi:GABA(A) receptor-associated protein